MNSLFTSLDSLLQAKSSLAAKTQRLAGTERALIANLNRGLSGFGYRLVPLDGGAPRPSRRMAPKRLHCPECDRRFSHPLPMARHRSATHGVKKKS
jgi:hypothetical protein